MEGCDDYEFFDRDPQQVAKDLLGTVVQHCVQGLWVSAYIIETEAYYGHSDKGSHASLGFTEKRRALFMDPGTIYMYYSRGGPSLNFTCNMNCGNAVLVKSGYPKDPSDGALVGAMQRLNPPKSASSPNRKIGNLCNGQTLLCKSLGITVKEWDGQRLACYSISEHFLMILKNLKAIQQTRAHFDISLSIFLARWGVVRVAHSPLCRFSQISEKPSFLS